MTNDRVESVKNKTSTKKRHAAAGANKSFDAFLKKQNDIVSSLKAELQESIAEKQQLNCAIMEKNKCIQELQKSIADRDNEIEKLNNDLTAAREENVRILQDFYIFKEKFYELEAHYDKSCQKQNREIANLKSQVEMANTKENQQLNELNASCQHLKQELHERNQAFIRLNTEYAEMIEKWEKNQQEFVRQKNDFENYRKQTDVEKNAYNEKMNQDLAALKREISLKEEHFGQEIAKLKEELFEKDELIRQCISDKQTLEEEKNREIDELNYKIKQIEKVFGQPTKMVPPMVLIPNTPDDTTPILNTLEKNPKPTANVAVTKPQFRKDEALETSTDNNNSDSQYAETSLRSRSKKIPRPAAQTNSSSTSNVSKNHSVNRKRGFQNLKNPSPPSTDDDDDDIIYPLWRPNNKTGNYVPETETDASEGFAKTKRCKK